MRRVAASVMWRLDGHGHPRVGLMAQMVALKPGSGEVETTFRAKFSEKLRLSSLSQRRNTRWARGGARTGFCCPGCTCLSGGLLNVGVRLPLDDGSPEQAITGELPQSPGTFVRCQLGSRYSRYRGVLFIGNSSVPSPPVHGRHLTWDVRRISLRRRLQATAVDKPKTPGRRARHRSLARYYLRC